MADPCVYYDAVLTHRPPSGEFDGPWTGRLAARDPHPDRRERIENVASILRAELDDRTT